jgi:hypothetical protein
MPTVPVAYEASVRNTYEARVRRALVALGSKDPDADIEATHAYLKHCKGLKLDPPVTAAGIYATVHHRHEPTSVLRGAVEARRKRGGFEAYAREVEALLVRYGVSPGQASVWTSNHGALIQQRLDDGATAGATAERILKFEREESAIPWTPRGASEAGGGYKNFDATVPEGPARKVQYYVQRHGYEMLGYPVPGSKGIWSVGVQFPDGTKSVITVPNGEVERVWDARATGAHEAPTGGEWEVTIRRQGTIEKLVQAAGRKPDEIIGQNVMFGEFYDDEKAQAFAQKMMRAGYFSMYGPRRKTAAASGAAEAPRLGSDSDEYAKATALIDEAERVRFEAMSTPATAAGRKKQEDLLKKSSALRGRGNRILSRLQHRQDGVGESGAAEAPRYGRRRWSEPDPSIELDTKRRAAYSAKVVSLTSGLTKVSGEDLYQKHKVRPPETGRETVAVLSDAKTNEPRAILWKWDGWGYGESGGISMVYWLLPGVLPGSGGAQERRTRAKESAPCNRLERGGVTGDCSALAKEIGPIETDKDLYRLFAPRMKKETQEVFYCCAVDVRGMLCGFVEVARGQVSKVNVDVEDIVQCVMSVKPRPTAYAVAHCHPSGSATPSEADKKLTENIRRAGKIAMPNTVFMDHLVIGGGNSNEYYSFTDSKLKHFSK